MQDWTGATAIVTGAASGLGAATAKRLADLGLHVCIFDVNVAAGKALASEINGSFARVDVSSPDSVAGGVAIATEASGPLRILVNCAGIAGAAKTVSRGEPHDADQFQKTIAVNLIGSFNCASQAAAQMVASGPVDNDGARGVIINTASVAAFDGQVGQLAYSASKGGVVGMTLPMARDLADKGIRVAPSRPACF